MAHEIPKTLLIGSVVTVVVLIAIYLFTKLPTGGETGRIQPGASQTQVSYTGGDKCATCHQRVTPDIVYQYAVSTMTKSGVKCEDCHVVDKNNPMGHDHEGFFITWSPLRSSAGVAMSKRRMNICTAVMRVRHGWPSPALMILLQSS